METTSQDSKNNINEKSSISQNYLWNIILGIMIICQILIFNYYKNLPPSFPLSKPYEKTYYDILKISSNATHDEINFEFQKLKSSWYFFICDFIGIQH